MAAMPGGRHMVPDVTTEEDPWADLRGPQPRTDGIPRRQLNTRLPLDLHVALKERVEELGIRTQEVVEEALRHYLGNPVAFSPEISPEPPVEHSGTGEGGESAMG